VFPNDTPTTLVTKADSTGEALQEQAEDASESDDIPSPAVSLGIFYNPTMTILHLNHLPKDA